MGTGQMLISIGAIVLLGTVILNTNRGITSSSQVMLETNFGLEAVSLCASTIDEAEYLPFDESTRNGRADSGLSQLTLPANLGQESSTGDTLNDFDDWNGHIGVGYRQEFDTLATGIYIRRTKVHYVDFYTLSIDNTNRQWLKRLDVTVWNTADSAGSTVSMYCIYGYWYFR
jgi:hypothetical protein